MSQYNELEIMWEEAVVNYLKVLSLHLLGGTKENYKIIIQDNLYPG
jgi:hypothetical protein